MTDFPSSTFDSTKKSTLQRQWDANFYLFEPIAKVSVFLVAGTIAQIAKSQLSYPFFSIAGSMAIGHLAVKIYRRYNEPIVRRLEVGVLDFQKKFPYLQIISFVFIVLIGLVSPPAACCAGVLFGAYAGIQIAASECVRNQQNKSL
jgi:ABC-type amino acid transport system permease subunit